MNVRVVAGRYVLEPGEPRRGGTAEVFKARDYQTADVVAVKLFRGSSITSDILTEFFHREREALEALEHPNIVRLLGAGFDDAMDSHFVVLEWIEERLQDHLAKRPAGWDDFTEKYLGPILEALAYAHGRRILHRDIKPTNILVDPLGIPKLVDFGIAKLMDSLRVSLTVSDYGSRLFSPPERLKGQFDVRGDLYSLGITTLACLAPDHQLSTDALDKAIYEAGIPDAAIPFLHKLVAPDPGDRYYNGAVALSELRLLQRKRPAPPVKRLRIYLRLTEAARRDLSPRLKQQPPAVAEGVIAADLRDDTSLEKFRTAQEPEGNRDSFALTGREFSYRLVMDPAYPGRLIIVSILELPPSLLEAQRDRSMPLSAEFSFDEPLRPSAVDEALHLLWTDVERHDQQQRIKRDEAEDRRLFDFWRDVLEVKEKVEHRLEASISFTKWAKVNAYELQFDLSSEPPAEILGQVRRVPCGEGMHVTGTVQVLRPRHLVLSVEHGDVGHLPMKGELLLDRRASLQAIDRQRRALDAVQWGRAVRGDLGKLLVAPERSARPVPLNNIEFNNPDLDVAKQTAVQVAMGSGDFTVVDGPPGTGKTTFITELVCQARRAWPEGRVLLTAPTHVAVDNAVARIAEQRPDLWILRVGSIEKIAAEAAGMRMEATMARWREEVVAKARTFIQEWAKAHQVDPKVVDVVGTLEELRGVEAEAARKGRLADLFELGELDVLELLTDPHKSHTSLPVGEVPGGWRDELEIPPDSPLEDVLSAVAVAREVAVEERDKLGRAVKKLQRDLGQRLGMSKDGSTEDLRKLVDHAIGDGHLVRRFVQLKTLQEEWLARFGSGEEFERALLRMVDVVAGTCVGIASVKGADELDFDLAIMDEASKAAPTEALVPMVRGRRWVLVGDPRQLPPFVDQALLEPDVLSNTTLTLDDLRATIFDRLIKGLPPENRVALNIQHRMLSPIGELISQCFYEGKLLSSRDEPRFRAVVDTLDAACVVWYSTTQLARRREGQYGTSFHNHEEATRIREWLGMLNLRASHRHEQLKVGVISGYLSQLTVLAQQVQPDSDRWSHLHIDINSVDAFQGQERDVLVYSVTRSNPRGQLGFLRSPERLNVALSRGRDGLVIFGDSDHCEAAMIGDSRFPQVLQHIRNHGPMCRLEYLHE
jgi:serine/threonine protein kinase